jgi:anaerobic ribonucleoside-triphosphate reductase activating protein
MDALAAIIPTALVRNREQRDRRSLRLGTAVDVLCFSGRPLHLLRRRNAEILAGLDALISGPYLAQRPTRLIWRGSANQELVPLSALGEERYREYVDFEPERAPVQVRWTDSCG